MELTIEPIEGTFSVCRLPGLSGIPAGSDFWFFAKTDEEYSLVCRPEDVPAEVSAREGGWRAFRIAGTLDFSLVGILAKLTGLLADAGIGIFAVSTYNTDYVLVKEPDFPRAMQILTDAGYRVDGRVGLTPKGV